MNAASTVTPTPAPPYLGAEHDPLHPEPIRPSGDAGDGWGRAAAYDAYADGLHTYAIWSLRDHDAAVDALYCAFVMADRHVTQLRQPEHVHPWLYAIMRHECRLRHDATSPAPSPVSGRLRPPSGAADPSGSLAALERSLRRAEFHSLEWPESEGLAPAHREILELTIRHGLDSQGLGLVLGLGQSGRGAGSPGRHTASKAAASRSATSRTAASRSTAQGSTAQRSGAPVSDASRSRFARSAASTSTAGLVGSAGSQGFGVLADAWRELERSLAAVAVAKGSREHCAQLAEMTFGWSGRLTATLRAPLTDHVDGCTRCQHYLHTVIGTPAAPTILPFVAAPRSLREMLLGELHDPKAAHAAGVDHAAIARRLTHFTADGFPVAEDPAPVRRRGTRRPQERSRTEESLPRRTPGANMPRPAGAAPAQVPPVSADESVVGDTVYRAAGSWAARVLPPQDDAAEPARHWRPTGTANPAAAAGSGPSSTSSTSSSRAPRDASGTHYGAATTNGLGTRRRPSFVDTPSGRFARHAPEPAPGTASVPGSPVSGDGTEAEGLSRTRTLHFSAPVADPPRGPDGRPRARHKSRPVRQAVTSVVALGAVGAVAAVSAALLGLTSEDHAQTTLGDPGLSLPAGSGPGTGGLSVTVSTAPVPAPSSTAPSSSAAQAAPIQTGGSTAAPIAGIGFPGRNASSSPPATAGEPTANPADFHVSVNQRSAEPNSITILLRNTGPVAIAWTATDQDSWIVLSQSAGTLGAGQSQAIVATATSAAPAGQWTSRIAFTPGGTVITVRGGTATTPPPSTPPSTPPPPPPPPSTSPTPPRSPSPGNPTPTPTGSPSSGGAGAPSPSSARQSSGAPSASATGRSAGAGTRRK